MREVRPMGKKDKNSDKESKKYSSELRDLQIELVKCQRHLIAGNEKVLVVIEGRDAAGKDGCIKHMTEHMSPRETRIVALGKPSDRDQGSWYFQRYVPHLPAAQEFVVFNRSWYNRAGVERVMGFCTPEETEAFLTAVPVFEQLLISSGIRLLKYYLDIEKDEQERRLKDRRMDPLKQWKLSPVDEVAAKHWKDYSRARDEMLVRSHSGMAPWTIVRADDKHAARLNLMRDLLSRLYYPDKGDGNLTPDDSVLFPFEERHLHDGRIAG
jgi:polyphosphate kinase 2